MTWINKIAFYRNIRNEVPNQELARELANTNNTTGREEISNYLFDKNTSVASDCLKVLYEIGYIKPELIEAYADTFLQLLEIFFHQGYIVHSLDCAYAIAIQRYH